MNKIYCFFVKSKICGKMEIVLGDLMKNKIKLVLADIDGTLLNSNHEVTEVTREAIEKLKQRGILFGIASGRPYEGVARKIVDWNIADKVDMLVTMNGVQLWDKIKNQRYSYFMLKKEFIREIIADYSEVDFNPCIYLGSTLYCTRFEGASIRSAENNGYKVEIVDPSFFWEEDREKLLCSVDPKYMPEVEAFYAKQPQKEYRGFKSQQDLFEFVDKNISKSYGIEQFCRMHGFTLTETLAFGDTSNDIEMLRDCGLGICMANGTEDAKSVSDFITRSNDEDGVAWYINEVLLKE